MVTVGRNQHCTASTNNSEQQENKRSPNVLIPSLIHQAPSPNFPFSTINWTLLVQIPDNRLDGRLQSHQAFLPCVSTELRYIEHWLNPNSHPT